MGWKNWWKKKKKQFKKALKKAAEITTLIVRTVLGDKESAKKLVNDARNITAKNLIKQVKGVATGDAIKGFVEEIIDPPRTPRPPLPTKTKKDLEALKDIEAFKNREALSVGVGEISVTQAILPEISYTTTLPVPDNDICKDCKDGEEFEFKDFYNVSKTKIGDKEKKGKDVTPETLAAEKIRYVLEEDTTLHTANLNWKPSESKFPDIEDHLRAVSGAYWVWNDEKIKYALKDHDFPIEYVALTGARRSVDDTVVMVETFIVAPSDTTKFGSTLLEEISNLKLKNYFTDYSFKIATPVQRREIDPVGDIPNLLYANINPTYNFYIPEYEKLAIDGTSNIKESVLPNMYTFLSQMTHDENDKNATINPLFKRHLTLNGILDIKDFKSVMSPGEKKNSSGQYFDVYSRNYNQWDRQDSEIEIKFKNQLVSHSNVNLLKDFNAKKELFPMYTDIKFSTDTNTEFAETLKDTDMGCVLMKEFISGGSIGGSKFREYITASEEVEDLKKGNKKSVTSYDGSFERRVLDVDHWFKNTSNISINLDNLGAVFLGQEKEISNDGKYKFFKSLMTIILNGKLSKLKKKNARTFTEILDGKLATSETVAYRIEKKSGEAVIQNFYLPNSNDINIHNFIDTQVKYGKEYTYNIYALEAVYGTTYKYENIENYDKDSLLVTVWSFPAIRIVEVPYYSYTNRLLDSPPVQPNVEIIPLKGIDNRLRINLSSNSGKYDLESVVFDPKEQEEIDLLKKSQDRLSHEPLQYESDDYATMFEVYRIDKHPASYSDFAKNKIKDLNTASATPTSMIDKVLPNKKYWYIFRSMDNHNHLSYPTPIYQVEIVNANGAIYPLIEVVDFKIIEPKKPSKKLKRIMQIIPAFSQSILNTEELDKLESVKKKYRQSSLFKLGVEDESLWEKKFKIRLTSKKTGKKVDINIQFKHEHLKIKPVLD